VAILEGPGILVELVHHRGAQRPAARPAGRDAPPGPFKVGIIVDDFDGTLALLRSRGVAIAYGPFPERPDQPANVIVHDNDGNLIQILGARRR
jgi:catechol 2,3-dioxygenase-like lactoylglutathione lyase family enzyme